LVCRGSSIVHDSPHMKLFKLPLFGKYNLIMDTPGHATLSLFVAAVFYLLGLYFQLAVISFLVGYIMIDIDHVFNKQIARFIGAKDDAGGIIRGAGGYTIRIFHGFEISSLKF
jgi:hypothetical protein